KIVDVFSLNENQNAVTITVTFEDPTKTLDKDLIKAAEQSILQTLDSAGFPLKA
ncbi:MAG: hypothetical protein GW917_03510, partial [Bdellovibrionales bacterium]|nr:hypothetical protein [Bdellovibrionales bacterium]